MKMIEREGYNVEGWLLETGWPTQESDMLILVDVYVEWLELYPRSLVTGVPNGDALADTIIYRMKLAHPKSQRDALIIAALLIVRAGVMALNDGIRPLGGNIDIRSDVK